MLKSNIHDADIKTCDDFEFIKSIIVYIDLILVYGVQEQKYNNKPYDMLNEKTS